VNRRDFFGTFLAALIAPWLAYRKRRHDEAVKAGLAAFQHHMMPAINNAPVVSRRTIRIPLNKGYLDTFYDELPVVYYNYNGKHTFERLRYGGLIETSVDGLRWK
jgi:hypothetical protein